MKRQAAVVAVCITLVCTVLVVRPRAVVLPANCPVSLTNPDGQALDLQRYDLRVAVHGPLALVEMEMTFRNPENRQMEGRFQYLLPPGATISRFAKEVNGKLMEGEVVEKLRAQAIYTEILHTMRDPALLEMDQGNRFSARVFPIPANGTVRLLLAYSQVVPLTNGARKFVVPLAGMPEIGEFVFKAIVLPSPGEEVKVDAPSGGDALTMHMTEGTQKVYESPALKAKPDRDVTVTLTRTAQAPATAAIKAGNYQMLCYRPEIFRTAEEAAKRDWVFYFDTSASNADTEARRLNATETLLVALVPVLRQQDNLFTAWAFDVNVAPVTPAISMNTDGGKPIMPEAVRRLRARHAIGATDLEAAMKHIGEQARAAQKPTRFVLVSDGIATLGAREARDVVAALGDWPAQHVMHALVLGNKQDEKMLNAIVEKTRGRVVNLPLADRMDANIAKALAEMQAPLGASFEFYDEGAEWIYPKTFRDVRPGSEIIVFSELKDGAPSKPGVIQFSDKKPPDASEPAKDAGPGKWVRGNDWFGWTRDIPLAVAPSEVPAFAPLLQREAYHAFLNHLDKLEQAEKNDAKRAELHKQRIEVSVRNRVLCPLTSLLVLETEDDYRRFGIERTALADIMVVGKSGIELKKRGPEEVPPARRPVAAGRAKRLQQELVAKYGPSAPRPAGPGEARSAVEEVEKALQGGEELEAGGNVNFAVGGAERQIVEQLQRALEASREPRDFPGPRIDAAAQAGAAPAATPFAPPPPATATEPPLPPSRADAPREADASRRAVAPGKPALPDWTQQYGGVIKEEQLNELRAKVQAAPRDRTLRNAYADMLKKSQQWDSLQGEAFAWLPFDPENPQVYEFLGNSATGLNDPELALRAFTSIAEIAPNRAALLARAGWLLLTAKKFEMAEQMFREALKNRQDDANIYRGLALSLWLKGNYEAAAKVLEDALAQKFHERYGDAKRVMREELGYILRAWGATNILDGELGTVVIGMAQRNGVDLRRTDALRATLCWETDANDVDLHVVDPNGEECFYSHAKNASGLELYSDQTQGLGPEVIRTAKALPGTYHVGVNYFSAGPMGVSRGVVVIMQPKEGVVTEPQIVPFCLVPGGPDMRHLGAAKY